MMEQVWGVERHTAGRHPAAGSNDNLGPTCKDNMSRRPVFVFTDTQADARLREWRARVEPSRPVLLQLCPDHCTSVYPASSVKERDHSNSILRVSLMFRGWRASLGPQPACQ